MSDEECECPEPPRGLPAYLATFADLMSLLMCFFVLLLSFSEMDVQKYKQVAGSMKDAFGVQQDVQVKDIPKGTSVIAQEFSPGRPDPTPLNEVRQSTTDTMETTLDVLCDRGESPSREDSESRNKSDHSAEILERLIAMTQADAVEVASALKDEIARGSVELETKSRRIVIRVKEQGSFPSGSATLRPSFIPIMDKIRGAIKDIPGDYSVEGHTDDVPISTARFRSNWELSSARAVSVTQELLKGGELDPNKFVVKGYGEVKPMVPNDTAEHRARNRRVEIVIEQGNDDQKYLSGKEKLPDDPEFTPELLNKAGLGDMPGFEIERSDAGKAPGDKVLSVTEPAATTPSAGSTETGANGQPAAANPGEPKKPAVPPVVPGEPPPGTTQSDITRDPFVNPDTGKKKADDEFF